MYISRVICLILSVFLITSCSTISNAFKGKDEAENVLSVEEMYNDAAIKLDKGRYKAAIEGFEDVERTYPYSKWATKSEIMSAYSSFKDEQYDDALVTLERFTKLHPGNEDIAYAYYLRALSFYRQISDVTKDQGNSIYAKSALSEVVSRFPDTKYANDAKLKLDLVNDHLAGKEVDVGRFYLKMGNPIAAINRFKTVVEQYQTTAHVPEALHRLVESYLMLGVRDEAVKYGAVLGYNYPDSKWYRRTYKLLEGKKLTPEAEKDNKGKWYDFSKIKGIALFEKSNALNDIGGDSHLIDEVSGEKAAKEDESEKELVRDVVVKDISSTNLKNKKSEGGFSSWFKHLHIFSKNTDTEKKGDASQ